MGKTIHNHKHYDGEYEEEGFDIRDKRREDTQRRKKKGSKERSWFDEMMKRDEEEDSLVNNPHGYRR